MCKLLVDVGVVVVLTVVMKGWRHLLPCVRSWFWSRWLLLLVQCHLSPVCGVVHGWCGVVPSGTCVEQNFAFAVPAELYVRVVMVR